MDNPSPSSDPEEVNNGEAEEGSEGIPEFKETEDFDLEVDVHMEAHQEAGTLVATGKLFGPHRADGRALGTLIRSFTTAIYEIAMHKKKLGEVVSWADVDAFKFASAHIRFIAGAHETMRLEGSSPSVDAAHGISELMQAEGEDLLELARDMGPKGVKAYRTLLKVIAESDDANIGWRSVGREPVSVTSIDASKDYLTLIREGESEVDVLTVPGHLSMADAELNHFKLRLPSKWPRPIELKRKRKVEGSYDEPVGQSVKDQGLWDSDVITSIRVEREREETVAAPRGPKYQLVSVAPVATTPTADAGPQAPNASMSFDDIDAGE